jgi:DNA-binding NtrC family response regulator
MRPAIVIVDDSAVVLAVIRHILEKVAPDYEPLSVENGAAALALIAQRPIALVLTDQHMPDMDGVALTEAIKAVAPQCPVILMTGSATLELQQRAQAAGAACLLLKPFGPAQLVSLVRAALAQ